LGFDLVTHLRTPETDHLHVYSLWLRLVVPEFGPRCEPHMRNRSVKKHQYRIIPYVSLKFHPRKLSIFAIFRQIQSYAWTWCEL
jgi:hypothetical protein